MPLLHLSLSCLAGSTRDQETQKEESVCCYLIKARSVTEKPVRASTSSIGLSSCESHWIRPVWRGCNPFQSTPLCGGLVSALLQVYLAKQATKVRTKEGGTTTKVLQRAVKILRNSAGAADRVSVLAAYLRSHRQADSVRGLGGFPQGGRIHD